MDNNMFFPLQQQLLSAHRKPLCIDYPLLNAPSETMHGLTYTEHYLKCMLAENLLIHGFEKDTASWP